ncbi:MAG: FAD-dependent oxidoreductase [Chitinophagaceae bacterium]|nr:FAD-dependent oxidoreductase [Chitinophagaceae bacterium]
MKRDGIQQSLWQQIPAFEIKNILPANTVFDVLIVGGGITGLSTALQLQKIGKKCLLAEAHVIGYGSTGGTTAHLNTLLDNYYNRLEKNFGEDSAQLVAQITRESIELIKSNIEEYQIDCDFVEQAGYLYAENEEQVKELEEIFEASNRAGLQVRWVTDIPVPFPFLKAMIVEGQASFHPTKYIYALAKAFEDAGGILLQQSRVVSVDDGEIIKATINEDIYSAYNLIYATHVPPGVNLLHFRCAPYRSYALALKLSNEDYPAAQVYDMQDPFHYFRTHITNEEKFLIVGGGDHKTGHEENTEACFKRLESYCRSHYDIKEVAYKWSSQYFEPTDGLPYIGQLPGNGENVFVATGFSGNGITLGVASSIILTGMIETGMSGEYAELFDPSRIKMVAGFNNFVKESADVLGQLIGKILPGEKLPSFSDLAHNEARVVKHDGHTLAIYKDNNGELHALNAACTHIKCNVAWNNAEQSWDCPCHGSRFSIDGEVLTAPARKDMEVIDLRKES